MAQRELEAKIAALEARLRVVEDIEELNRLMATYERYLDSMQNLDDLV